MYMLLTCSISRAVCSAFNSISRVLSFGSGVLENVFIYVHVNSDILLTLKCDVCKIYVDETNIFLCLKLQNQFSGSLESFFI